MNPVCISIIHVCNLCAVHTEQSQGHVGVRVWGQTEEDQGHVGVRVCVGGQVGGGRASYGSRCRYAVLTMLHNEPLGGCAWCEICIRRRC